MVLKLVFFDKIKMCLLTNKVLSIIALNFCTQNFFYNFSIIFVAIIQKHKLSSSKSLIFENVVEIKILNNRSSDFISFLVCSYELFLYF